jgi:endonuclease/exonuclease/phosphatase family metal-dependent hydrolase
MRQLSEIVRAQPPEALVVAAGDFNFPRDSWLYQEFLAESGMIDPLAGDPRPTVRAPPGISDRYALPIDFALVRAPALAGLRVTSDLRFDERVVFSGRPRFLSDHVGVELRVSWDEAGDKRHET